MEVPWKLYYCLFKTSSFAKMESFCPARIVNELTLFLQIL